jgi:L-amino acid N-acyltransferase YncA
MIREATKDDLNVIVDLWEEMMEFHIQRSDLYQMKPNAREIYINYIKDTLKNPDYILLVYEIEDKVLGYLMATESNDPPVYEGTVGMILELSVTENHRHNGIGEELLIEIEKIFIIKGIKRIECMVSDYNEISKSFWFKNDYKPYNIMCVKTLR